MKALVVMLFSILVAGCAALPPDIAREPYEQKTYRTGSNLPQKETGAKSGTMDPGQLPPNIQLPRGGAGG
jgi:starvation-inducible outer membrane lipoprotein